MKRIFLLWLLFISVYSVNSQNLEWVKNIGLPFTTQVEPDNLGNICVIGTFSGIVDFDPGNGSSFLTASANNNSYLLKLDINGNFLWAKNIENIPVRDFAFDNAGNIYFIGVFQDTVDFDPGPGEFKLISNGEADIVIVKLTAAGDFLWAKTVGGTANDTSPSISVDGMGNVYYNGWFRYTVDFDPGPGVHQLTALGANSDYDTFISKLDAGGNFIWVKQVGGDISTFCYDIALDQWGNVFTTGAYISDTDFDPGPGTYLLYASGAIDIYILKLDTAGNFIWAKSMGGTSITANDRGRRIKIDNNGDVYTIGTFDPGADFDPGPGTFYLTSAFTQCTFISKLDSSGNFVWAKKFERGLAFNQMHIDLDGFHNIYVGGNFSQPLDADPGPGTQMLTSAGFTDITHIKLDSAGNFTWAISIGNGGSDFCYDIYIDFTGNSYLIGGFRETVDFDPGGAVYNLIDTSITIQNGYILKLGLNPLPIRLTRFEVSKNKNDAVLSWATASESNSNKFEIERSENARSFAKIGEVNAAGNSNTIKSYQFTDRKAGLNFPGKEIYYRFKQVDLDGRFIYSPVRSVKFEENIIVSIYPNPANDIITIETNVIQAGSGYAITDEIGKIVLKGKLTSNKTLVDIKLLPAGVYFVQAGKNIKALKIIKQ